jgi:hypothetical protein
MQRNLGMVLALVGLAAEAAPSQCLGTGGALVIFDETLVVSLSPDGFENQLKATLCQPLIKRPGILFDYSSWDVGVFNYLSPIYDQQGLTIGVVPLSFLELRVDASALGIWVLPLDGAGYFAFPSYTRQFTDKDLPNAQARTASGVNVTLSARLQGELPVFTQTLVVTNSFQLDYWYVGEGSHYYNARRDVVLARSDWVVKNNANLLFKVKASKEVSLQFGVQDDFTFVPASNYVANIIGVFLSVPIRREGFLRDIEPFVRFGAYTHHAYRSGFQLFAGISIAWGMPVGNRETL